MIRPIAGTFLGLVATASVAAIWFARGDGAHAAEAWGIVLGGGAGSLLSGCSTGAQVALVRRRPASSASYGAMVAGFFAKGLVLVAGVLLLQRPDSPADASAFGVAFVAGAALAAAIGLSAFAPSKGAD